MDKLGEQFAASPRSSPRGGYAASCSSSDSSIVAVAAVVVLVPGLESLRDSFSGAKP